MIGHPDSHIVGMMDWVKSRGWGHGEISSLWFNDYTSCAFRCKRIDDVPNPNACSNT